MLFWTGIFEILTRTLGGDRQDTGLDICIYRIGRQNQEDTHMMQDAISNSGRGWVACRQSSGNWDGRYSSL